MRLDVFHSTYTVQVFVRDWRQTSPPNNVHGLAGQTSYKDHPLGKQDAGLICNNRLMFLHLLARRSQRQADGSGRIRRPSVTSINVRQTGWEEPGIRHRLSIETSFADVEKGRWEMSLQLCKAFSH